MGSYSLSEKCRTQPFRVRRSQYVAMDDFSCNLPGDRARGVLKPSKAAKSLLVSIKKS